MNDKRFPCFLQTLLLTVCLHTANAAEWKSDADGNWNDNANWTNPPAFPNGIDAVADFTKVNIAADRTITVEEPITLGTLSLGDSNGDKKYFIQPGTAGALTFDVSSSNAAITQAAASRENYIYAPIVLNDPLDVVNNDMGNTLSFSGPITNSGSDITLDGGGSIAFQAGSSLSGGGDLVLNGGGYVSLLSLNNTSTGDTILNENGRINSNGNGLGDGNVTINEGIYVGYYQSSFTRALGAGAGQFQITGAKSGFSANNKGFNLKVSNDANTEVTWGDAVFNPSILVLQDYGAGSTITSSKLTFYNKLDLHGATRTIAVDKDEGNSNGNFVDGYAQIINTIRNSDTNNPAGLIKTGPGRLILTAANTYNGGTTVSNGAMEFARADALPSTNNVSFHDGSALWVRLGGANQFTAGASGEGSLGGLLTAINYSGAVDLVLRPSGTQSYGGPIPGSITNLWIFDGSMVLSGTNTYTGETIIGRRGGSTITVTLGSNTALPSGTHVQVDTSGESKLDLNGFDATIGLLKLGSNNGGARGKVSDTAGTGTLTLTNGVFCDDHNNGNGAIYAGLLDLNGTTQTFSVRDGAQVSDLLVTSAIQNGGLIFDAVESGAGLELAGTNTYTGGTQVSGGRLIVSGQLGDSSMTISGGTVEGSGTLTFNLIGASSDVIALTGGTFDASGFTLAASGSNMQGEYVIVDASGGGTISGTFASIPKDYGIEYHADRIVLFPPASGTVFRVE